MEEYVWRADECLSSRARELESLKGFTSSRSLPLHLSQLRMQIPGWRGQGWGVSVSGMASGGSQTVRGGMGGLRVVGDGIG